MKDQLGVGKESEAEALNNSNRATPLMAIPVTGVSSRVVKLLVMKPNKINSSLKLCVTIGKIKVKEANRVLQPTKVMATNHS